MLAVAGPDLVLAVLVPYVAVLGIRRERLFALRLPRTWTRWLAVAISEEELELEPAIHPGRGGARDARPARGGLRRRRREHRDGAHRLRTWLARAVPPIIVGALVLAGVTSLPNAVAAVYLARRERGAAVLSTSLNSNAFNVLAGLLIPTTVIGIGAPSGQTTYLAFAYVAMTLLALGCAYLGRGLRRAAGATIILAYLVFVGALVAIAS